MKHIAYIVFVFAVAAVIGHVVNAELRGVADRLNTALVVPQSH